MQARRTKAYLAIMSRGDPIKLDEEELQKVAAGANAGELIVVKQGVINPSYLVCIENDKDRLEAFRRETQYGLGQGEIANRRGIKPLGHIYSEGGHIAKALEESTKRIEASMPKQLEAPENQ